MLALFAAVRPTGRIRYVVAQHMAKDGHDELVVRLIQRESALPVVLATDGMTLQTDTVYIIPSGKDGRVHNDTVALCDPAPHHVSTPSVNTLFASIASNYRGNGIGIVLSGTGVDGAQGCRAIKAAGGLTLAQQPLEAKFDGMPQAAIDAHAVDQVLPVQGMADTLATRFPGVPAIGWLPPGGRMAVPTMASIEPSAPVTRPTDPAMVELQQLLRQVRQATHIDFGCYKEDTLLRRLEKRKALLGITTAEAYQAHIRHDPSELHALQRLFLVSVSSFFRDRESFAVLQKALADHLAHKPPGEAFKVWVPGCASGEEAYTLAIILRELLAQHTIHRAADTMPVHITGTDLNPEALKTAQAGIYRPAAFKEMDEQLLARHFQRHGDGWAVHPELRECVCFERRDVLSGPPGGNTQAFDLVSCRNLLIYMKTALQDQLVTGFHQALRVQGLLFIGQSESLSFVGNSLFAPVNHYHRLFRKRP